jgi:predicted ABC-type exoprotein transport system permease subunit
MYLVSCDIMLISIEFQQSQVILKVYLISKKNKKKKFNSGYYNNFSIHCFVDNCLYVISKNVNDKIILIVLYENYSKWKIRE